MRGFYAAASAEAMVRARSVGATCTGMRVAVASDDAGFPLKTPVLEWLAKHGHEGVDMGTDSAEPVDYPDVITPAARAVAFGDCQLGIVLGGSGTGEQIVANKIRGVRCVQATDPVTARLGREHNDANVLSMGARIVGVAVALGCVEAFMSASFEGGRHARRVEKLRQVEIEEHGQTIGRSGDFAPWTRQRAHDDLGCDEPEECQRDHP